VIAQETIGRMGTPKEIAAAVLGLCSDAASCRRRARDGHRRRPNGVAMFIANRDAVAVNAPGVEVTPGGAAFIEDAIEYSIFERR